jgi:hypothetical protein
MCFAQSRLELGDGHPDRVEIGRIGRRPPAASVATRIWQHLWAGKLSITIAGAERGEEYLSDVKVERGSIHGAIEHHGRCLPMRDGCDAALPAWSATLEPRHLDGDFGLVDQKPTDRHRSQAALPRTPDAMPCVTRYVSHVAISQLGRVFSDLPLARIAFMSMTATWLGGTRRLF